jgi:hypothetical protein
MAQLPEGRTPLDNRWFVEQANSLENKMSVMIQLRNFPNNTCPASRHVQIMAESLTENGKYPMLDEDPRHCAGSLVAVLNNLYTARTFLDQLGYTWATDSNGNTTWVPKNNL